MPDRNLKPRYEVERLEGTRQREIIKVGKNGEFVKSMVEEPAGFMVYFPSGSSIRVRTEEELRRRGFDVPAPIVDMDTGEVLGVPAGSLKAHSEQKQVKKRRGFDVPAVATT